MSGYNLACFAYIKGMTGLYKTKTIREDIFVKKSFKMRCIGLIVGMIMLAGLLFVYAPVESKAVGPAEPKAGDTVKLQNGSTVIIGTDIELDYVIVPKSDSEWDMDLKMYIVWDVGRNGGYVPGYGILMWKATNGYWESTPNISETTKESIITYVNERKTQNYTKSNVNSLASAGYAYYWVESPSPTPDPSPSPTPDPSPSPTPGPSPSPTPGPNPTPGSKPTPAPTKPASNTEQQEETVEESFEPVVVSNNNIGVNNGISGNMPSNTYNFSGCITPNAAIKGINKIVEKNPAQKNIAIYSDKPITLNKEFLDNIRNKNISLTYYFMHQGHFYSITITSNVNSSLIFVNSNYEGPLYVGKVLETSRLIK